jgi:hypothetical protein
VSGRPSPSATPRTMVRRRHLLAGKHGQVRPAGTKRITARVKRLSKRRGLSLSAPTSPT